MCGLIGHKMIACPKFAKMQKMFQGKIPSASNGKVVANVIVVILDMNLIVNVATKRKITKKIFYKRKNHEKTKQL
jgi:hypothetical protein